MPLESPPDLDPNQLRARLAELEDRVARLEAALPSVTRFEPDSAVAAPTSAPLEPAIGPTTASETREGELERTVGQDWFGRVGILALMLAGAFVLSLPLSDVPPLLPSLAGWVLAAVLATGARRVAAWFNLPAHDLRGAAIVLLYVATARITLLTPVPVLPAVGLPGRAVLVTASAAGLALALGQRAEWLAGLSLATAVVTSVLCRSSGFGLMLWIATALTLFAAAGRLGWVRLLLAGVIVLPVAYVFWSRGSGAGPWLVAPFVLSPLAILGVMLVFGWGLARAEDAMMRTAGAFLNCAFGYGAFLLHTGVALRQHAVAFHLVACGALLALAAALWRRGRDQVVVFFYVMTAYAAASAALAKAFAPPALFVWLAAQSLVVVATAIAFRSRIIVVANFLIFLLIGVAYALISETESGLAAVFGLVALLTARLLNWQQARLELRTGMMRNAYLVCALVCFPYALRHALPAQMVAYAWILLAVGYYAMNVIVRSDKYRWLGHATLLLTAGWLAVAGAELTPLHRIASFLALGVVLLAVSLTFSRWRKNTEASAPASG